MSTTAETLHEFPSLTREQLAERLGVSEGTIFRWLKDGKAPPHYRVGSRRLWREQDVLEWLERECREVSGGARR